MKSTNKASSSAINSISKKTTESTVKFLYEQNKNGNLSYFKNAVEAADMKKDRRYINISAKICNNKYIITIEDNGIGIDSQNTSKIFNPLITTKTQGTGLGLTLTQKIIEEHNGNITVESEKGKWTKFVITLPITVVR